jgi:uncharacterized protein (TIGR02147 family)
VRELKAEKTKLGKQSACHEQAAKVIFSPMEAQTDYRHLVKTELLKRVKNNPVYSGRAFARDLKVSNAFLFQVLNGKRSLSEGKGLQVAKALGWPSEKVDLFLKLIRLETCKDPSLKNLLYQEIQAEDSFFNLDLERFRLVSDWIHFAIMELTRVRGFDSDSKWIAKRLGVSKPEVEDAVERLLAIGLLFKNGDKLQIAKNVSIADVPSEAIRQFHKTHLNKAVLAMDEQKYDLRHFSGITTAINPKKIPEAEKMIKAFRRKLMRHLETGEKTAVYQVAFQFFQLDKGENS